MSGYVFYDYYEFVVWWYLADFYAIMAVLCQIIIFIA